MATRYMTVRDFAKAVGRDRGTIAKSIKAGKPLPNPALGTWTSAGGRVFVEVPAEWSPAPDCAAAEPAEAEEASRG